MFLISHIIQFYDDFGQIKEACGYYDSLPSVESRSYSLILVFTTDDISSASGFNVSYLINQSKRFSYN